MGSVLMCSAPSFLCQLPFFPPLVCIDSGVLGIICFSRVGIELVDSVPDLEKLETLASAGRHMRNFNSCSLLKEGAWTRDSASWKSPTEGPAGLS